MKNIDFKVFINNLKLLGLGITTVFVMDACKTYVNTVTGVYDKKKILIENTEGEERLIDCSKKTKQTEQLLKDIPYFEIGDAVKVKQSLGKNYKNHWVLTTKDCEVLYQADTIQKRKDQEYIAKVKEKAVNSTKSTVR